MNIFDELKNLNQLIPELENNSELKKWFFTENFYIYFETEKYFKIIEVNTNEGFRFIGKPFSEINKQNDIKKFLYLLICSFPDRITCKLTDEFIEKEVNSGSNKYFSKKKNMFINRIEHSIQSEFGLTAKKISNFIEKDRNIIFGKRGKSPNFNNSIFIEKINSNDYIGLYFLSKKLFRENKLSESNELAVKAKNTFGNNKHFIFESYLNTFEEIQNLNDYNNLSNSDKNDFHQKELNILKKRLKLLPEVIKNLKVNKKDVNYRNKFKQILINEDFQELKESFFKVFTDLKGIDRSPIDYETINNLFDKIHYYLSEKDLIENIHEVISVLLIHLDKQSNNVNSDNAFYQQIYQNENLKTITEINLIEKKSKEKWIITPDFKIDLMMVMNQTEIFKKNQIAEIKTKYFFPSKAKFSAKNLKNRLKGISNQNKFEFYEIPELVNIFNFYNHEIVLYEPNDVNSDYFSGYYRLLFNFENDVNEISNFIINAVIKPHKIIKIIDFIETNINLNKNSDFYLFKE